MTEPRIIEIASPKLILINGKAIPNGQDGEGRPVYKTEPGTAWAIEGLDGWIASDEPGAYRMLEEIRAEAEKPARGARRGTHRADLREAAIKLGLLR